MDPKELRGLVEAYKSVYTEVEQLDEMGQTRTTGQATAPKSAAAKPQPQMKGLSIGKGGFNVGGKPVKTGVSPIFQRPGAKPAAKPAPAAAKPSASGGTRPAAAKPAPAAKPAASGGTKPAALDSTSKVTPTKTVSQPPESKSQASAGEIRGMVGRSMERQATPTPAPKLSARAQALKAGGPQGGARERMLNQDVDLFDLIKGHLLDEGHAETEEQAIAIMANMSSEWRDSIIEAVKGESPERRKALAAERRKGIKPLSAKEGEKYASHKISQMSYTKRAKMGDDD